MPTYRRMPVAFVKGRGARLWDEDGTEYLDFVAGVAVCALGHGHPKIAQAIAEQAQSLVHVSNLYHHRGQTELAENLTKLTGMENAFFCNSGAEAVETAIKI